MYKNSAAPAGTEKAAFAKQKPSSGKGGLLLVYILNSLEVYREKKENSLVILFNKHIDRANYPVCAKNKISN